MLGYLDFMVLSKHIMEIFPDEDNITADIYRYFNFHPTKVVEIYNFILYASQNERPHKMKKKPLTYYSLLVLN